MTKYEVSHNSLLLPRLDYYNMGADVVAFSTTRSGGHSTGNYAGFNINPYCGDTDENVCRNRQLLCQMLGIDEKHLLMPHQIHKTEIKVVDNEFFNRNLTGRTLSLDGFDALMTDLPEVCIGVSTADCIPVLLYDASHHAVCAIHAGWRGTVARIVEKAVAKMTEVYDTAPINIKAQIGPGISLDSFEVGDEVYDEFRFAGFNMSAISQRNDKWHIDLHECNRLQLVHAGVDASSISMSGICTFKSPDRYFSARRLGVNSGRIFTAIMIKCYDNNKNLR